MTIQDETITKDIEKKLFSNFIEDFLTSKLIEEGRSPDTIKAYRHDLHKFLSFEGDIEINSPKFIEYMRDFLKRLNDLNYTKKSLGRKISSLKSYFVFLQENGLIMKNPMRRIKTPRINQEESLPKFLDHSDMEKIFDVLSDQNNFKTISWSRYYIIVRLLYSTMARVSELCDIKVKDVDFQNESIRLRGKGNKERIVPIDEKTGEMIKIMLNNRIHYNQDDYLLVNTREGKLTPRVIQNDIQKIKKICGFPESKIITPHIFRHTGATHLRRAGMDISELKDILGHSNINTTMIYAKNDITQIKKSYKKMHPLNNNNF